MKKFTLILAAISSVASCSQITTNKDEASALEARANGLGDSYVTCVVNRSLENASRNAVDVPSAITIASRACESDLAEFKTAQREFLKTQLMMTEPSLQASVDALDERATNEVGEALLSATRTQPAAAVPAAATASAVAASSASGGSVSWNAEQQAYLDCMDEQAHKYATLDESAPVVADVAQDRCQPLIAGPDAAVMEQQGRTLVMGVVLDAKLARKKSIEDPAE